MTAAQAAVKTMKMNEAWSNTYNEGYIHQLGYICILGCLLDGRVHKLILKILFSDNREA